MANITMANKTMANFYKTILDNLDLAPIQGLKFCINNSKSKALNYYATNNAIARSSSLPESQLFTH